MALSLGEVWGLAVSPNGKWVVTSGKDRSVRLWEKTQEILVLEDERETEREEEAEAEACSLVLGFLILQLAIFGITSEEPRVEGLQRWHKSVDAAKLFFVGLTFLLLIFLSGYMKRGCRACHAAFDVGDTFSMAMAWCLQQSSEWMLYQEQYGWTLEMARVKSAFIVSAVTVAALLFFAKLADLQGGLQKRREDALNRLSEIQQKLQEGTLCDADTPQNPATPLQEAFNESSRKIMNGFAICVGLAWDKAFEASEHVVVHKTPIFHGAPVTSKTVIAIFLCTFVLPAWAWHIVPAARKPWIYHFVNVQNNRQQTEVLSRQLTKINN